MYENAEGPTVALVNILLTCLEQCHAAHPNAVFFFCLVIYLVRYDDSAPIDLTFFISSGLKTTCTLPFMYLCWISSNGISSPNLLCPLKPALYCVMTQSA